MKPVTEEINPRTKDIDRRSTIEIVRLINNEDATVAESVSNVLDRIAAGIDLIFSRLKSGGRLIYIGTGTSGRLGVLDASECPPTFGVSPDLVRGMIAGGFDALHRSVEAAEDDPQAAARDLQAISLSKNDAVIGISASGNTPYTLGGIEHARSTGCATIAVTCNPNSKMAAAADVSIAPVVGPEAIAGSSRMKAGTAQKMILNMLSTGAMARLGYVYSNLMINLRLKNEKLSQRGLRILANTVGLEPAEARELLAAAGNELPVAMVMAKAAVSRAEAVSALKKSGGRVRKAFEIARH